MLPIHPFCDGTFGLLAGLPCECQISLDLMVLKIELVYAFGSSERARSTMEFS